MVIYDDPLETGGPNAALQKHYTYIGVVYWKKLPECALGCSRIPWRPMTRRLPRCICLFRDSAWNGSPEAARALRRPRCWGACPAEMASVPVQQPLDGPGGGGGTTAWEVGRVGGPPDWDLLNQSWNCQLAPVTQPALATILQTNPDLPGFSSGQYKLPDLGGLSSEDLQQISPH